MTRKRLVVTALSLIIIVGLAASLYAKVPSIEVPIDGMEIVRVGSPINRVVLGSSKFARAKVVTGQQIMLFGLEAGSTTMHVWTEAGIRKFRVQVANITGEGVEEKSKSLLREIGEVGAEGKELRIFVPEYRQISEYEQYISQLLGEEGRIVMADEASGKIFALGPTSLLDNIENLLQEVDVPSGESVYTRQIQVTHRPVGELKSQIENLLSEDGSVTIDQETNSLLVSDKVNNVKKIENYINDIDVQTKSQVRIKARFVEVLDEIDRDLGVNWESTAVSENRNIRFGFTPEGGFLPNGLNPSSLGSGIAGDVQDPDPVGIDATIQALESQGKLNLISAPTVMTRNQQDAVLEIKNEQSYVADCDVTTTDLSGGGSREQVDPSIETIEDGITLNVTPLIGKDDVIQLDVVPELKRVSFDDNPVSLSNDCPDIQTPTTDTRKAELKVAINSGQTLVIGGLNKQENDDDESKVPFFGNIPLLGHAFKSTSNSRTNREISIFLTAERVPLHKKNKSEDQTSNKDGGSEGESHNSNPEKNSKSNQTSEALLD